MRNFGTSSREALVAKQLPGPMRDAEHTRNSYALPRLPPDSILHPEHVPHSPLEIGSLFFFTLFAWGVVGLLIAAYYLAVFMFGVG